MFLGNTYIKADTKDELLLIHQFVFKGKVPSSTKEI